MLQLSGSISLINVKLCKNTSMHISYRRYKDELVKSGHLSNEDVLYRTKLWHKETLMDWLLCTANQLAQKLLADKILSD